MYMIWRGTRVELFEGDIIMVVVELAFFSRHSASAAYVLNTASNTIPTLGV